MSARVVAIVSAPARSRGLQSLAGKPLVLHSIDHARAAASVERIVVSTDDADTGEFARRAGAEVVAFPPDLALDAEVIVLLPATSPLRGLTDVEDAIGKLRAEEAGSVVTVRRGQAERVPTGSIRVLRPGHQGGKVAFLEQSQWSTLEVHDVEDLELCELVLAQRARARGRDALPAKVRLVVFDFDGVFTDNTVIVREDGTESVTCNRGDGHGLKLLRQTGLEIVVLSTEKNPVVQARCRKLGLPCLQGVDDKETRLRELLTEQKVSPEEVVYVGNDVNDLGCLELVGCAVVPRDAHRDVLPVADLVLESNGGRGAVREICDLLLDRHRTG